MEALLDQADALARSGGDEPPRPDFTIPEEYAAAADAATASSSRMVLRDAGPAKKGRGWFAAREIPAGTLLLVAKPLGMVMDWEDDDDAEEEEDPHEQLQQEGGGEMNHAAFGQEQDDNEDEDDDDADDEMEEEDVPHEPRLNELLLLQLLHKLADQDTGAALWHDQLATLFPRTDDDLSALPAWVCHSDQVFFQVEALLSALEQQQQQQQRNNKERVLPVKEISKRLPLIIRYNILSVETCSELLSYPGPEGHSKLSGVGLYHQPSFFNHSSRNPVVSRWAVGDVMAFVANQDIAAGTELCISYIEHDVLCEPAARRNAMLSMDFDDGGDDDDDGGGEQRPSSVISISGGDGGKEEDEEQQHSHDDDEDDDDGPEFPVVDSHVQNELMSMDPFERLSAIDELMQQALGEKLPEGVLEEEEQQQKSGGSARMETEGEGGPQLQQPTAWFQCDVHNLRILKAITLDGMGQTSDALMLWNEAIQFVERKLPPADESLVVLHAQAALCSLHKAVAAGGGDDDDEAAVEARQHAKAALETHNLLFGGGVARFRRRMHSDLKLALRPKAAGGEHRPPEDVLWPVMP